MEKPCSGFLPADNGFRQPFFLPSGPRFPIFATGNIPESTAKIFSLMLTLFLEGGLWGMTLLTL